MRFCHSFSRLCCESSYNVCNFITISAHTKHSPLPIIAYKVINISLRMHLNISDREFRFNMYYVCGDVSVTSSWVARKPSWPVFGLQSLGSQPTTRVRTESLLLPLILVLSAERGKVFQVFHYTGNPDTTVGSFDNNDRVWHGNRNRKYCQWWYKIWCNHLVFIKYQSGAKVLSVKMSLIIQIYIM